MDIRHTITRFGATALIGCGLAVTAIPATFAQNGEESVTYVYSDKATSHISEVWYKGETLKITGEGFLTQEGNFSVSIPWQDDLDERISVDVYLLSGSLKDNDTARGGKAATVKIEARSVQEAPPSATASASASASATASATASVVATPSASVAPSASATPSASASATAADEVVASVDAKIKDRADGKATASVSPSATASASASVVATPSASASATESASADQNASVANEAKDQLGDSTSATEQVSASAESTRFANCAEVAAAGLAPMPSSHPDFRKKFDNDGNGLGCEVINSEVTDGSSSNGSSGSSSRNSGGLDNLGGGSSSSSSYTSSRAQRSSLANTGASNAFTIAGMGLVALGLGVAGVTAVRNRKNS